MRVNHIILEKILSHLLVCEGFAPDESGVTAHVIVWNDRIGRSSQGVKRLREYIDRIRHGLIVSPANFQYEQTSACTAILHGGNGSGHYLSHFGMARAVEMATQHGLGAVGVNASNHNGTEAYYVQMAAEANCIGVATTNCVTRVVPHGGIDRLFGTNPIAFGAPRRNGRSLLVDLSAGMSSGSKLANEMEQAGNIPPGVLLNENGQSLQNADEARRARMLPFGGAKGSALAFVVEVLSAVLTGAALSPDLKSIKDFSGYSNTGHFFLAMSIERFGSRDAFYDRMELLMTYLKEGRTAEGYTEILYPGEQRWRNLAESDELGVELDDSAISYLRQLADKHGVDLGPLLEGGSSKSP
ncbi:Ldh family oxidoreductase [Cerasicoccus frondis]|uniref:Ldh family oxidoreductase n=1 Tax=Cerasicoccus frondis TaxID=490090 RepID=UPI00285273F4|nr:Ldh family oxidoreductase [Cerasicoccus frondis]